MVAVEIEKDKKERSKTKKEGKERKTKDKEERTKKKERKREKKLKLKLKEEKLKRKEEKSEKGTETQQSSPAKEDKPWNDWSTVSFNGNSDKQAKFLKLMGSKGKVVAGKNAVETSKALKDIETQFRVAKQGNALNF